MDLVLLLFGIAVGGAGVKPAHNVLTANKDTNRKCILLCLELLQDTNGLLYALAGRGRICGKMACLTVPP